MLAVYEEEKRYREEKGWLDQQQLEKRSQYTVNKAARASSMSRRTVWYRVKHYGNLISVTRNNHRTLLNYKKLVKLNQALKSRSDWVCQQNKEILTSRDKVAKVMGLADIVSLEKAIKLTGFSRRYLRRLMNEHKLGYVELVSLTELNPPRKISPYKIQTGKLDPDLKQYYSYYKRRRDRSPVVYVDLHSLLHRAG